MAKRYCSLLADIPTVGALPYIGSMLKLKKLEVDDGKYVNLSKAYDAYPALSKKYGSVYTIGIPGMGVGTKCLLVICTDPKEYMNILHNEGKTPFGATEFVWMVKSVANKLDLSHKGMFEGGDEWRRIRIPTQKALLSPETVKGYISGVCKAAEAASTNFESYKDDMEEYLNYCSFDMFCTVAFGQLVNTTSGTTDIKKKNFCQVSLTALRDLRSMQFSTKEFVCNKLGWETSRMKELVKNWKFMSDYGHQLVDDFLERRDKGELDEIESNSYIAVNLKENEKNALSLKEFKDMTCGLLMASVDTTSGVLSWVLLHLAIYPEVQSKVRQEILSHMTVDGGSADLSKMLNQGANQTFPYLSAVIREVHRMRPASVLSIIKSPVQDVKLGEYKIPKGARCQLDSYTIQNDPSIVENPTEFLPERWLPDAVLARRDTPAEVLDHSLLRDPFSAGARKCPGSRVARLEIHTLVATLVRKYTFSLAPDQGIESISDIPYYIGAIIIPKQMPKFIVTKLEEK